MMHAQDACCRSACRGGGRGAESRVGVIHFSGMGSGPVTVKVGVVGPGVFWESRYRPALERLAGRIGVCAVYDPVATRAEQVASESRAMPVSGMLALAEMPSVQAVLLLDPGWAGLKAIELLARVPKPIYVAGTLGCDRELLNRLQQQAAAHRQTLMPEFTLRHTPSTGRLHELMATKLGRPARIVIEATVPAPWEPNAAISGAGADFLVGLFDWCQYVIRTMPLQIQASTETLEASSAGSIPRTRRTVTVEFAKSRSGGVAPTVELRLSHTERTGSSQPPVSERDAFPLKQVVCERGHATLPSAAEIHWQNGQAEPIHELLTSDRSSVEVMLDHFCRRVVGGLIPIADIGDVCRSVELARAVDESLRTGAPVPIRFPGGQ